MNDNRLIASALIALFAAGLFAAMVAFRQGGLTLPERSGGPTAGTETARPAAGSGPESIHVDNEDGAVMQDHSEDEVVPGNGDDGEADGAAVEARESEVEPVDPDTRVEWKFIRRLAACEREFDGALQRGEFPIDPVLKQKITVARTASLVQELRIYKEYGDDRETSGAVLIEYARAGLIGERRDISVEEKAALTREAGVLREAYALIDGEESAFVASRRAQKLGAAYESFQRLAEVLEDDVDMHVYDQVFRFPNAQALHLIDVEKAEPEFAEAFHREFRMAAQDKTPLGAQVGVMLGELKERHRILNDEARAVFGEAFVLGRTPRDLNWPPQKLRAFFLLQFKRAVVMAEVCANFYRDLSQVLGAHGKRFETVREAEWLTLLLRL